MNKGIIHDLAKTKKEKWKYYQKPASDIFKKTKALRNISKGFG